MDDETYVPEDPKQVPGPEFYHARYKQDLPIEKRIKKKKKFAVKFLIWQIIDEDGNVSKPSVTKGTMNSSTYLKCLKNIFIAFHQEIS